MELNFSYIKVNKDAIQPTIAYKGESAAIDFYSCEDKVLLKDKITEVKFGIKIIIPKNYCLLLYGRSSVELKLNTHLLGGVIDYGFTSELSCFLKTNQEKLMIAKGQKICQGLLLPVPKINIMEATYDEYNNYVNSSLRNNNGLGSSGK